MHEIKKRSGTQIVQFVFHVYGSCPLISGAVKTIIQHLRIPIATIQPSQPEWRIYRNLVEYYLTGDLRSNEQWP